MQMACSSPAIFIRIANSGFWTLISYHKNTPDGLILSILQPKAYWEGRFLRIMQTRRSPEAVPRPFWAQKLHFGPEARNQSKLWHGADANASKLSSESARKVKSRSAPSKMWNWTLWKGAASWKLTLFDILLLIYVDSELWNYLK